MVEVLATVLASPQFLYVTCDAGDKQQLSAHDLATRLSMFLWCSVPDAELRQLADSGRLLEPEVLRGQVTRMLSDDRVTRLSKHFVHQWLDMQLLEFRSVPRDLESLKQAMQREPIAFFEEMLRTRCQRAGLPPRRLHDGERATRLALRSAERDRQPLPSCRRCKPAAIAVAC